MTKKMNNHRYTNLPTFHSRPVPPLMRDPPNSPQENSISNINYLHASSILINHITSPTSSGAATKATPCRRSGPPPSRPLEARDERQGGRTRSNMRERTAQSTDLSNQGRSLAMAIPRPGDFNHKSMAHCPTIYRSQRKAPRLLDAHNQTDTLPTTREARECKRHPFVRNHGGHSSNLHLYNQTKVKKKTYCPICDQRRRSQTWFTTLHCLAGCLERNDKLDSSSQRSLK